MNDDKIDTPDYMQVYEQQLAAWRAACKTPMPTPTVPKLTPDETVMMPMRDGVKLYTELFFPVGTPGPFPTILTRTPYPDSTFPFSARPIDLFRRAGYAVAVQSCRGTWRSEGRFRFFQNEPEDGYDCIEWLAVRDWSNGKVGMYGSSYLGSVQWLAAGLKPPHLSCIAPQSPTTMFFYETPFIGGVFFKHHVLTWPRFVARHAWSEMGFDWAAWLSGKVDKESPLYKAMLDSPNLEAVQRWHSDDPDCGAMIQEALQHPTLDDWWQRIMLTPQKACDLDIPVFAITGFHDGDQAGCLHNWTVLEANETQAGGRRHLMVGPWRHAQMPTGKIAPMGEVRFDDNASFSLPKTVLRFFDAYLKGDAAARERLPNRCRLYTSGTNTWHEVSSYPPQESRDTPVYLRSGGHANSLYGDGVLGFEPPGDSPPDLLPADPETPVPAVGIGEDARDNEARHDVLVYTTAPLEEDLTVLGPVRAVIHLAADAKDCDVAVRIEDVRPDGVSVNMTGEFGFGSFRARYRDGFDREVLLVPGEPARLSFHVCHMGHVFRKGHCIRIAISATVANVLEPNHHTGEPLALAREWRKATETLFHDTTRPSHIVLPLFRLPTPEGALS
jgi:putative CocE/NonD family hydrolase